MEIRLIGKFFKIFLNACSKIYSLEYRTKMTGVIDCS